MARRRYDEDDGADRIKRHQTALVVTLGVVFGLLALFILLGALSDLTRPRPRSEAAILSREEFRALVIGKTKEQVVEAIGRPDSTGAGEPGKERIWTYRGRTRDRVSGKLDSFLHLIFEDGKCVRVNYY